MEMDSAFQATLRESQLSNQSWELIMTAGEFELKNPDDPEAAELVMDLSNLGSVLSAIKDVESQQPGQRVGSERGLMDRVKSLVGLGGDGPYRQEAERLAAEYTRSLQERLEETGRWEQVCERASSAD